MSEFMPNFQTDLTISVLATVSVRERGEIVPHGGYSSVCLVDGENEVEVSVGIEEDQPEGTISLRFSTHHAVNEETGRAFHFNGNVSLSWEQVEHLHRYLAYLIAVNYARPKQ
jgi:hypothetical protein